MQNWILTLGIMFGVCAAPGVADAQESAADKLGFVYWTHRAARDGSELKQLVPINNSDSLAIDTDNRKLYWTERGRIRQANTDGSHVEVLISGKTAHFGSLIVTPPKE